ncbi:sugar/nucleoside kinase (ribokinase family) [Microvirga lupini]|uniref:Sugar/nucleoside kinase (Ribokinase family) n=1 Tax=Microvirga lupini TaxID=420324 RepID=A0A7W4YW41_9HYPH|nr:sugar/nucleoside kinase (ribokinase family) [Microvirga lupini]
MIALAGRFGLMISLDPSWDDELIRRNSDCFEICAGIDLLLPNVEEGKALTGENTDEAILRSLRERFSLAVLKRGEQGAMIHCESTCVPAEAIRVNVVDTTGAGDAFNAGFLHSWLDTSDLGKSLTAGIEAGGLSVQSAGAPPRAS